MLKYFLPAILAITTVGANAQWRHQHYHRSGGYGWGWVAPTIIGGVVGYEIARSQQPVIIQQTPVVLPPDQNIIYIDGIAYRKQLMLVNGVYQEILVKL